LRRRRAARGGVRTAEVATPRLETAVYVSQRDAIASDDVNDVAGTDSRTKTVFVAGDGFAPGEEESPSPSPVASTTTSAQQHHQRKPPRRRFFSGRSGSGSSTARIVTVSGAAPVVALVEGSNR
jgi:hypothetical protein